MEKGTKKVDLAAPLRHIVGIAFFFVIAITGIQVFSRYVLNRSLVWSEETVRFLVVWMCMVGVGVSNYDDDHMMLNIVVEKLPIPVQFLVYTIRQALIIVFCVVCSYASIPLLKAAGKDILGAIPVPAYTWRLAGTVGLAVQALYTLLRWFEDLGRFRRGGFCLKDADTQVAESVEDTEIPEGGTTV